MIRFVLSLAFSLAVLFSFAQNLVPNPSFELTTSDCEPFPGLQGWFSPNLATPDLFSLEEETCWTYLSNELMQELSFIAPLTGNNMVGLFCADPESSNIQTREYLSCRLVEPLTLGEVYRVSFSTYRWQLTNFAVDRLGIHFSTDSLSFDVLDMLPIQPQWENDDLLITSDEWTGYEFLYTSTGGEQFLTFGCFRDFNEMQVIDLQVSSENLNNAYYVFDDFLVETAVGIASSESKLIDITVAEYGLYILTQEKGTLSISNLQGQEMLQMPMEFGENIIPFNPATSGVYFATLYNNERRRSTRFFWH